MLDTISYTHFIHSFLYYIHKLHLNYQQYIKLVLVAATYKYLLFQFLHHKNNATQNTVVIEKTSSESDKVDPMKKIKEAKELLDVGAITEEEFDKIKAKYLKDF